MHDDGIKLELPRDVSPFAKDAGPQIPLKESLVSSTNIILLISLTVVTTLGSWLIWPNIKPQMG